MKRLMISLSFVVACGGGTVDASSDSGGGDAGLGDATLDIGVPVDSPVPTDTSLPMVPYDGTTGKPCSTDADCHVPGGPNLAQCSKTVFSPEDYFPTGVCVVPGCATVTDTKGVHYCDGPDDPSSPGICEPYFGGGSSTICLPKCTYDKNGGAASGCAGKNACWAETGAPENGVGYCFGGCTQDGDCQDGQKCQLDDGLCVQGVTPPTKTIGAACTKADSTSQVCNCLYGGASNGYCSSFCVTGGPACPGGYTCDALQARAYGYTTPNAGMAGYCTETCASDASACPPSATCTNVFASGPDCIPP